MKKLLLMMNCTNPIIEIHDHNFMITIDFSPLLIKNNLPDDGKKKKAVAKQRYFHAPFLNYGGFDFQSRRFFLPIGKSTTTLTPKKRRLMEVAAMIYRAYRQSTALKITFLMA